jgi:hypothetical protein
VLGQIDEIRIAAGLKPLGEESGGALILNPEHFQGQQAIRQKKQRVKAKPKPKPRKKAKPKPRKVEVVIEGKGDSGPWGDCLFEDT